MNESLDLIIHLSILHVLSHGGVFFVHLFGFLGFFLHKNCVCLCAVLRVHAGWGERWTWEQVRILNWRKLPEFKIWWAETETEHRRNLQAGCLLKNSWGDIGSICTAKFSEEADKVRITLDLEVYVWRTGNHLESKATEKNQTALERTK